MTDGPEAISPREAAVLFNEQIRPLLTGPRRDEPVILWVGGQPGSGKTTIQSAILARLGRPNAFPLDGDDLLAYHPRYIDVHVRNDLSGAQLVAENVGGPWWNRAARLLRYLRIDTVISAPLGGAEWAVSRFREFRKAAFRVEVAFVATHEAISLQGVVDRYRQMRLASPEGVGRRVLPEWHELTYTGVLATADTIYRTAAADALYIGVRGGALIHANELEGGHWKYAVLPSQLIEAERNRPWAAAESAQFLQKQGQLRAWLGPSEWDPLLDTIDRKAAPVVNAMAVLDDRQLDQLRDTLPQTIERAALLADVAQEKADALADRYRDGTDDRALDRMRQLGASPEAVEQARSEMNRERWSASMTAGNLGRHARDLTTLNDKVREETHRRADLDPDTRTAEEFGRQQHRILNPEAAAGRVLPAEPPAVVLLSPAIPPPPPTIVVKVSTTDSQTPTPGKKTRSRTADKRLGQAYDRDGSTPGSQPDDAARRRNRPKPPRPGGPSI